MEYHKYFEIFLNIEDRLAGYMRQLEFSKKTEALHSAEISLLLLQTCPVIESYMVQLSTRSPQVLSDPLYQWEGAHKLWTSDKGKILEKENRRAIRNFLKFSYVVEKVFSLSSKSCLFYYSERFQNIDGDSHFRGLGPFKTLSSFIDYKTSTIEAKKQFPTGLDTPKWWTAYNKIKHNLDEAEKLVTYKTAIEALGGLFALLSNCDTNQEILERNGYVTNGRIKTRLFSCPVQDMEA